MPPSVPREALLSMARASRDAGSSDNWGAPCAAIRSSMDRLTPPAERVSGGTTVDRRLSPAPERESLPETTAARTESSIPGQTVCSADSEAYFPTE
ncbi:hypothetical protein C489_11048 [Natrinema versiforme JCM 10478]|uniref:Uncharacterized protein n=1 Tax=Natrinema versiforme JCM 10478 TaxID=1227496 RepID=L9XZS5_9EURY|nr:hypothetical protein C489_11048 [Natrinema versiforme JCM 10478]